jgi:hypothetical protein
VFAKLLETFTKKSKYDYDTAENGLVALEAFKHTQRRHDIILMGKQKQNPYPQKLPPPN